MDTMEIIKWVLFYGMEIVVVGLVGVTLLAGVYQLIRNTVQSDVSAPAPAHKS